jgi:hypothetical protein
LAELVGLALADAPERWEALGFEVRASAADVGGVWLQLGGPGVGITAWSLAGTDAAIDGLPVAPLVEGVSRYSSISAVSRHAPGGRHPNGAVAVDHVVVVTPAFERTREALAGAGMPLKRVVEMRGTRMGFRRIGPAILEVVEAPDAERAAFWGLTIVVSDLDGLAARLGERLGPVKPAVQPGRRIATVSPSAGLTTNLAFMDPATVHGRA